MCKHSSWYMCHNSRLPHIRRRPGLVLQYLSGLLLATYGLMMTETPSDCMLHMNCFARGAPGSSEDRGFRDRLTSVITCCPYTALQGLAADACRCQQESRLHALHSPLVDRHQTWGSRGSLHIATWLVHQVRGCTQARSYTLHVLQIDFHAL